MVVCKDDTGSSAEQSLHKYLPRSDERTVHSTVGKLKNTNQMTLFVKCQKVYIFFRPVFETDISGELSVCVSRQSSFFSRTGSRSLSRYVSMIYIIFSFVLNTAEQTSAVAVISYFPSGQNRKPRAVFHTRTAFLFCQDQPGQCQKYHTYRTQTL